MADEHSREPWEFDPQMEEGHERPMDPISDIDITKISDVMFNSSDDICVTSCHAREGSKE